MCVQMYNNATVYFTMIFTLASKHNELTTYILRHNKLRGAISISQGDKFCHALIFYPPTQSYFLSNVRVSQLSTSMSTLSESVCVWNCFYKKKLITCSILKNDLYLC
jgi:hypothetical protein